jgi:predicted lipoprotein
VIRGFTALACGALLGCPGQQSSGDAGPDTVDRRGLALAVIDGVVLAEQRAFVAAVEALNAALSTAGASADAQPAWTAAMLAWQLLEPLQFGPTAAPGSLTGGAGYRDAVYSWPLTNRCAIERGILDETSKPPAWFDVKLINTYGLDALEFTLFAAPSQTSCPVALALQPLFDAAGQSGMATKRLAYARALGERLAADASAQLSAWESFRFEVERAGETGAAYPAVRDPLDHLITALLYLDTQTKDTKLAHPAGLSPDCAAAICPEAVEHRWSGISRQAAGQNLLTFAAVLEAGGLGQHLRDHSPEGAILVGNLERSLALAASRFEAQGSLAELVVSDPDAVLAMHAAVKDLTDLIKTQLIALLNIRLPNEGDADND